MRRIPVLLSVLVALSTAACGGSSDSPPSGDGELHGAQADQVEVVSDGDLVPADLSDAPSGEVVLALTGRIDRTNAGDRIDLDLATIERLPLVDLTVYEPFEQRDMTFRGVWLEDLLVAAGVDDDATIRLHALDDYEVTFSMEEIEGGGALLATMSDGERMPISKAGPTRVVFSDGDEVGENKDLWIWSLDVITVE